MTGVPAARPDLPWRGPGPGRPELPLPPDRMPSRRHGNWRKRWRYVAAFCDELLLCAGRVQVGRLGQTFWMVCDRAAGRTWERTRLRPPGARGEVWTQRSHEESTLVNYVPDEGSLLRIEAKHPEAGEVRAFVRFGGGSWVEVVCPTEEDQYVWTRKRAGVPVECDLRIGRRRWRLEARGVEDESAGYHPHQTEWSWSAGVGHARDGRPVGWNVVSGINDPPRRSERAIWVDGKPFEPGPVAFDGLGAVAFDDGARLEFEPECERRLEERRLLVRYSHRHSIGSFSGSLPGDLPLDGALGVMEHHEARW